MQSEVVVFQVREEVAKESGVFIPRQQLMSPPYMVPDPFFGPAPRAMNGHLQRPTGMADIFAPLPPPYMGTMFTPFRILYGILSFNFWAFVKLIYHV